MTDELKQIVGELNVRLQQVQDELAIHRLIVRYGFAVDCGDAEAAMSCFTQDAVYQVASVNSGLNDEKETPLIMKGRQEIGDMVLGDLHQSLLPNCAHTMGPVLIEINGEQAEASGYSRIYLRQGDKNNLFRLGINHWQFEKVDGNWLISKRESEVLGTEAAQSVLTSAIK